MLVKFKNFSRDNVTMYAPDGRSALVVAGQEAMLDEVFTFILDPTRIRQMTFAPVLDLNPITQDINTVS